MGRGRSKAKETKIARDLKYSNPDMDLEKLAKELHGEIDNHVLSPSDNSYEWNEKPRKKD
jgi:hypothetical protein